MDDVDADSRTGVSSTDHRPTKFNEIFLFASILNGSRTGSRRMSPTLFALAALFAALADPVSGAFGRRSAYVEFRDQPLRESRGKAELHARTISTFLH